MKIAIISAYPTQKCGIATFSHDLYKSLLLSSDDTVEIIIVCDSYEDNFPEEVVYKIVKRKLKSYLIALDFINEYDLCIIQPKRSDKEKEILQTSTPPLLRIV